MDLDLYSAEFCLAEGTPLRLGQARGVRVVCTAGRVWLTLAGQADDVFLGPGESHVVDGDGLVLLEALGRGRVRLERAPAAGFRFRWLPWSGLGGGSRAPAEISRTAPRI